MGGGGGARWGDLSWSLGGTASSAPPPPPPLSDHPAPSQSSSQAHPRFTPLELEPAPRCSPLQPDPTTSKPSTSTAQVCRAFGPHHHHSMATLAPTVSPTEPLM